MRIIGGQNRGLKLATPKGREVRPILGRVRESLFGILRNDVPEANVADLFAGTGVIGLEALSRGATLCVFIERDATCIATIKENIRRARLEERCRVVRADAFRSGDELAEHGPFRPAPLRRHENRTVSAGMMRNSEISRYKRQTNLNGQFTKQRPFAASDSSFRALFDHCDLRFGLCLCLVS